ncbi:MAG: alkaline phosphatase family protein [Betaproteobacteria bacterium]
MLVQQLQTKFQVVNEFVYPQYDENCISQIPDSILKLFGIRKLNDNRGFDDPLLKPVLPDRVSKVVLLVIDGFGFNQFLHYHKENPFLSKLVRNGEVYPKTSVFPSQTTNALTTLNTGLTPQQHGLFEYFVFLKNIGIVNALRFERLGKTQSRSLIEEGLDPNILLYKSRTIHETLAENCVPSFTHMNASNALNICSKLIFRGSQITPSPNAFETTSALRRNLEANRDKNAYFFVHLETLDTISHIYGPGSFQYQAELSWLTYLLNKELVEKIDLQTAKETLILVTADHGAVNVNPAETTYLNYLPKTLLNLKCGPDRKPIMPTGSPREVFLHIKENKLQETKDWLTQKISGKAQVLETSEAVESGLFGSGDPSQSVLDRLGNLMILPCGNGTVWFESPGGCKLTYLGQHGGLSGQEMLVPFGAACLSNLKSGA